MRDKYNRSIHYMRLSVTDRCNLRCRYCMPEIGVDKKQHDDILRHEEMVAIVQAGAALGIDKVRLTGGEPLIRKGIVHLVRAISNIEGIEEITMTTNGLLLDDYLDDLIDAGLDRINLSLDTMDEKKYAEITRGGDLRKVLSSMSHIMERGLKLKINTVLIGGFNDDEIEAFVELTRQEAVDVRFIELMPIGEASVWNKHQYIANDVVLKKIELEPVLKETKGSPARYYRLKDGKGKVGLINPISCSFCQDCNRIRVTSDGKVKPCLHSNDEIDLMHVLREGGDIMNLLKSAILRKPESHLLHDENHEITQRNMNRIGG